MSANECPENEPKRGRRRSAGGGARAEEKKKKEKRGVSCLPITVAEVTEKYGSSALKARVDVWEGRCAAACR